MRRPDRTGSGHRFCCWAARGAAAISTHETCRFVCASAPRDSNIESAILKRYSGICGESPTAKTPAGAGAAVIRTSSQCRDWMRKHGVNFQPPLSGALTLHQCVFLWSGGARQCTYYRSAERLGVRIRYNAPVHALELHDGGSWRWRVTNVLPPKPAY